MLGKWLTKDVVVRQLLREEVSSVVIAASLALASLATSLLAFQFLFGVMVGAATAAILVPIPAPKLCDSKI